MRHIHAGMGSDRMPVLDAGRTVVGSHPVVLLLHASTMFSRIEEGRRGRRVCGWPWCVRAEVVRMRSCQVTEENAHPLAVQAV